MNEKEIFRLGTIRDVCEKRIKRKDAAQLLNVSVRQVQRLITRYRDLGAVGLVHQRRGQSPGNKINADIRSQCLNLIHKYYSDFGPTLAREKLIERHGIKIGLETLRQWMIADGLWVPHFKRKPCVYQPRYRRDCYGELIQIDGSHHDWFEGRSDKCCLLVFIDDATGKLMNLRFSETESAFDYMVTTREYVEQHGKPTAFYSDRHAVFHVNKRDAKTNRITQFGRVLHDLNIELICANSSQAKGRVERANKTLQDRLVKEMRLQHIDNIEQANVWLPDFIADFNQRFARAAQYPKDMHRPLRESVDELHDIFAWKEPRKVSKSLTFQYDKVIYLIDPTEENQRLVHQVVKVLERPDGTIAIQYGHRKLGFKVFDKLEDVDQGQIVDNKRLGAVLKFAQAKQQQYDQQQKRSRSKSAPRRTAQQRAIRQLEEINPVLVHPEQFRPSTRKKP
ncbi:ISNCY family transposase [Photobacterium phosphoreum]|uniref:ISNCY family transposase n=1 Tax=Photobacterium phosphoreum TaxID=659 RepID=A0AAW5A1V1_PHOPO|nr:ISNCY family transposase [Photobacterium phosphoreum]MCD9492653.1 ISNCY family transposase [Photobacterium phosphoreum]MCF2191782.1 ISNCY family transposase [Photobacterium phosphoreum]MCF2303484.1 ISNCY family transposase [Photobacterium phosphoreum]